MTVAKFLFIPILYVIHLNALEIKFKIRVLMVFSKFVSSYETNIKGQGFYVKRIDKNFHIPKTVYKNLQKLKSEEDWCIYLRNGRQFFFFTYSIHNRYHIQPYA